MTHNLYMCKYCGTLAQGDERDKPCIRCGKTVWGDEVDGNLPGKIIE